MPQNQPFFLLIIPILLEIVVVLCPTDGVQALPAIGDNVKVEDGGGKKLDAELDSLVKHIEKINSSISAFFKLEQKRAKKAHNQLDDSNSDSAEREEQQQLEQLEREKDDIVQRMLEERGVNNDGGDLNGTGNSLEQTEVEKVPTPSSSSLPTEASRMLCQFFVFGILFGIVCSISACSCLFRSRSNSAGAASQSAWIGSRGIEANLIRRLAQIREPFGPDKPYCLKFDERGLCYASPLAREAPPLPNYEEACKLPTPAELTGFRKAQQQQQKAETTVAELRV